MVWRNPPAGAVVGYATQIEFDWGTIPAGDSVQFIPYAPPAGLVPWVAINGPLPAQVSAFGIWAGSAIFSQMFNQSGSPAVVGVVSYTILLVDPEKLQ